MCVVSMIGTIYQEDWQQRFPTWTPSTKIPMEIPLPVTRAEFEELKREVAALAELLRAAKKFDDVTNQKDCEMEEKVALIKGLAKALGVDMSGVFE